MHDLAVSISSEQDVISVGWLGPRHSTDINITCPTAPVPELKGVCEKRNCNITVVMIYILWSWSWSGLMLHFLRFSTQPTQGEPASLIDISIGCCVIGSIWMFVVLFHCWYFSLIQNEATTVISLSKLCHWSLKANGLRKACVQCVDL